MVALHSSEGNPCYQQLGREILLTFLRNGRVPLKFLLGAVPNMTFLWAFSQCGSLKFPYS